MRPTGALATGLYLLALVLRLVPLTFSPLPYNIDGFPLARIGADLSATGTWRIDETDPNSYNQKMPAFAFLWSAVVQLGGLHPLADLQWFLPILTSFAVVSGYLVALKLTGHRGVALLAGLFLAVFGSFLFLTSAVMKESLGLVVLPIVVLLFHGRADPRKRGLAVLLLLLLPFLHHLTALMALGSVTALLVLSHRRAVAHGRFAARTLAIDLVTGPALALPALAYYDAVGMPFLRDVTSADDVVLFLAITTLVSFLLARAIRVAPVAGGHAIARPTARTFVVPAIAFGGLLVNAGTGVFAGAGPTRPLLLTFVLPGFLLLTTFVIVGWQTMRRTANRANDVVLAILAAPAALTMFGFLRGLDPLSLAIVYRAFDFMDLGLAVLGGVGIAVLSARASRLRSVGLVLAAAFAAALVATTPLAWSTQAALGVENVTTPAEFRALARLAELGAVNMTSDQRIANVAEWWLGIRGDASLPIRLEAGDPVPEVAYAVVLERWTSVGAQVHPAPNVVVSAETLGRFLDANRIEYVTGLPGDRIFVIRMLG